MIAEAIRAAVRGEVLEPGAMRAAMEQILEGEASGAQIAALAVALRMRGETTEELAAAAAVLRERATPMPLRPGEALLDTCGTGGDGASTFNISTTSAIVVAACGVAVAKHGNRAVSSRSGSADVLEALGVRLVDDPAALRASLDELSIAFFFAPAFHGALRHAASVRRELGLRTFFNLLGPLANPAAASHQIVGIYDGARVRSIAEVLGALGVTGAWVVHGYGGLDEVSPSGPTHVAVLSPPRGALKSAASAAHVEERTVEERTVEPADFGLEPVALETLVGGDAARNAEIARAIFAGERGGPRSAVVINAAAGLLAAGVESDARVAAERAAAAIDSGDAERLLSRWAAR